MSSNKNALIRYKVLDQCFRNPGRKYFWQDLADACEEKLTEWGVEDPSVSRRTIYDDMRFMRSEVGYSAPITSKREGRKAYYFYEDRDFSINNQPLNEEEIKRLKSAIAVLSRFDGLPQFEWLEEILFKLEIKKSHVDIDKIIAFDNNRFLKGLDLIGPLFNAIHNRQVLEIKYREFLNETVHCWIVHPYFLKEFNNRWFLFGHAEDTGKSIWNIAVDRIISLQRMNCTFNDTFRCELDTYFEDLVGVTHLTDSPLTKIELKLSEEIMPYVATKPIHGSQMPLKKVGDHYRTSIEIKPNYELYMILLSYGGKIEVLGPQEVRNTMISKINALKSLYNC